MLQLAKGRLFYDVISYLTVITVVNVQVKHTFVIQLNVHDWLDKSRPISLKMKEKFQEEEIRNNNVENNSLVSAYRIAYHGIPA